jgi:hypothetical protein
VVTASRFIDEPGKMEIRKGNALIRRCFNLDPTKLTEEEWARRYVEAEWVMERELTRLTNRLSLKLGEVIIRAMGFTIEDKQE